MNRYEQTNTPIQTTNNPTTTPTNKITRTNPYNQQNSRLNTNSKNNTESNIIELLPNKVSALDSNVLFQDMDRVKEKNVKSTNSNSLSQSGISSVKAEDSLGLITNVFLGATNKFVKGSNLPSTPSKLILPTEEEPQDLPPSKVITRNRQQKSTVERLEGQSTERSQPETARKLGRKQPPTRQLKFVQKKEESSRQQPSQIKVEYSNKKNDPPQEQKTEKVEEDYPKLYQQPAQRPTPNSRSRLITQPAPKQQEPQPTKVEEIKKQEVTPKPQVKPALNRLVKSRLQSNFSQSVSQIQQIPTQNDFSKIEIRQNITTQQPQIPPKQEIKPKPYSRSFITKKNQPQPNKMNASTINPISTSIIKSQQNEANIKQQVHIQLKKSSCAGFIIKRLMQNRLLDAFSTLKANKQALRIKINSEGLLLSYAIIKITKHKENNLLRLGIENIKKKFTTPYIASLKSYTDLPTSYKNTPIILIDRLYSAKIRQAFHILKYSLQTFNNKVKCLTTLQTLTKKKTNYYIKIGMESIRIKNQTQFYKLNQFAGIYSQVSKNKVANAFIKLTATKPVNLQVQPPSKIQTKPTKTAPAKIQQSSSPIDTTNPALIDRLQKLKKVSLAVNEQISTIKSSLQQKKSSIEQEKGGFSQKITLLKHQNGQASNEIEIKKHRNDQIQKQMENITTSNKQPSLEGHPQQKSDKFELITNIYISNFKNQQETISTQQIINNYQLHPQDSALLFRQWDSILHNVELKRLIAAYEGVQGRQNKGRSNLLGEQTLVSKLIRSYIKEQYFWNWIHVSAQNI